MSIRIANILESQLLNAKEAEKQIRKNIDNLMSNPRTTNAQLKRAIDVFCANKNKQLEYQKELKKTLAEVQQ